MSQSAKAALIALLIIVALTVSKFVLYAVSGSISVLSEAWHSFTDVATTLLVLVSILRQERKNRFATTPDPKPASEANETVGSMDNPKHILKRGYAWFRNINSELKISCLIGVVLLTAAISILWRAVTADNVVVTQPLMTGIIFIGLSFGSFFLYRFEETIGDVTESAALTADSHHNRADMAISLLTGFSLILYHLGTNIDRWVGLLIAAYILIFASELLVNSIGSIYRNEKKVVFSHPFTAIIRKAFHGRTYRKIFDRLDARLEMGALLKTVLKTLPRIIRLFWHWTLRFTIVAATVAYAATTVYTVKPEEKALVSRFGKIVTTENPVLPGLHLKLPYPIDRVTRFQTETIRTLSVGNASSEETAMIWTQEHGDNKTFISGDNNFFLPFIVIHYRIKNIHDYYLSHRDGTADKLLASTAYQLLNHRFAATSFYDLILNRRAEWTEAMKNSLQVENDRLRTGLEIVNFCLKDLHPPITLAGAYEDVVAAQQLRKQSLNNAERKVVSLLSRERIQSMKTLAEAESDGIEKKSLAEGEAQNYLLRLSGYRVGGSIMKDLLILKAAEETLKDKKIVLVDPNSGIDEKWVYMEEYMMRGRKP